MIGDPFTMVVAIVLIATIGKVLSSKYKAQNGIIEDEDMMGNKTQRLLTSNQDTSAMQDEIRTLKERIQVLERIATDNSSANDINRQIEELRQK
jgi:thiamine biosynthesis lipoprotein ApbE